MDSFERKGSYYTASLEIDRSSVNNNVSNLDNNSNNLDLKFFFFLPIYQLKILESTSTLFFLYYVLIGSRNVPLLNVDTSFYEGHDATGKPMSRERFPTPLHALNEGITP